MRRAAAFIAALTGIVLLVRVGIRLDRGETLSEALSFLTQFFTILTNTLVCVIMALIAAGKHVPPRVLLSVTISIACVGLIYHLLLAHLEVLSGIELLADHGVHTVVPILTVVWWLVWAEKPPFRWFDPILWVVWPLLYCAYAMYRATFSGFYPYPFIDMSKLSTAELATNMVGLVIGFVLLGALLLGLGHVLSGARRAPR